MSNKSAFKAKVPKKVPRQLSEIEKEYHQTLPGVGQLQYEIAQKQKALQRANDKLEDLNYEAAARKELDAKNPPKTEEKTQSAQAN